MYFGESAQTKLKLIIILLFQFDYFLKAIQNLVPKHYVALFLMRKLTAQTDNIRASSGIGFRVTHL